MTEEDSNDRHGDYTDPSESGLRSGKGNGFLKKLLRIDIHDKKEKSNGENIDDNDSNNEHGDYTDPEESGLRSGTGFLSGIL